MVVPVESLESAGPTRLSESADGRSFARRRAVAEDKPMITMSPLRAGAFIGSPYRSAYFSTSETMSVL
jgi:hypothetical protein